MENVDPLQEEDNVDQATTENLNSISAILLNFIDTLYLPNKEEKPFLFLGNYSIKFKFLSINPGPNTLTWIHIAVPFIWQIKRISRIL